MLLPVKNWTFLPGNAMQKSGIAVGRSVSVLHWCIGSIIILSTGLDSAILLVF